MSLHTRTTATLEQLGAAHWFRAVGTRDTEAAIVLSSWDEAIESCSSLEWENLLLEAANRYRAQVAKRDPNRFQEWNARVDELKPLTIALVSTKTRAVVEENDLPRAFTDTVQWDILHLCLEAEYADVYSPGFFASQAYWYLHGHFPCGWRGNFPTGTLVIF